MTDMQAEVPFEIATPVDAQNFYEQGMQQLDGLLVGERVAKEGLLLALAIGGNAAFIGGPGTGKTELIREGTKIVDLAPEEFMHIETKADLMPKELSGAKTTIKKAASGDGIETEFAETTTIEGSIKPRHVILDANEFNRTSPSAMNSLLELIENRVIESGGELTHLDRLWTMVASLNPSETSRLVFPISQAHASRFGIGALMGASEEDVAALDEAFFITNFKSQAVDPVISAAKLRGINEYARKLIALPQDVGRYAIEHMGHTRTVLADSDIHETGGRIRKHVRSNALGLAALRGQTQVTAREIDDAFRFVNTAMVGMHLDERSPAQIADIIDESLLAA